MNTPEETSENSLQALQKAVRKFNRARSWRRFHSPKNLAMALTAEATELMEPMRWLTTTESWRYARTAVGERQLKEEMADVLLVLLSLADYLELDLLAAGREKLAKNETRYPAALARGRADKYTAYASRSPRSERQAKRQAKRKQ